MQLPLDLETADRYSADQFITTAALSGVMGVLLRPDQWLSPHLILQGPTGSGKTHLGHMFAARHKGQFLSAEATFHLDTTRLLP
ncbi:MAG: chromosomal replication initiator DnaA, partial [Asticcacaulis sp.]